MAKYVVQERKKVDESHGPVWVDVANVEGEPRERRATILKRALDGKGYTGTTSFRVLDEASAHYYTVESLTQTKLVIS